MEKKSLGKAEYRSSLRSKALIREALLALMTEKNFDKISITDVVRKADINRGTFYAHFHNTSEVLKDISSVIVGEIVALYETKSTEDVIANPYEYLRTTASFLEENKDFYKKLLSIGPFLDVLEDVRHETAGALIAGLRAEVDESDRKKLYVLFSYFLSGVLSLYSDILLGKVSMTLEESTDVLMEIMAPGRQTINGIIGKA